MIMDILGDHLFPEKRLSTFKLKDMIKEKRRVIVSCHSSIQRGNKYLWSSSSTFKNTYANDCYVPKMVKYNKKRLRTFSSSNYSKLYKISWTLTPDQACVL